MSPQDNTFIDAYGLELSDELQANYAEPTQHAAELAREPAPVDAALPRQQSYRFDAAAQRRSLQGPHFDMRRVATQPSDATASVDAFDATIIDVGAAWVSSPLESLRRLEEATESPQQVPAEAPKATEDVPEVVASESIVEEAVEVAAPVAAEPEPTGPKPTEPTPEEVAPESIETAEAEPTADTTPQPSIKPDAGFTPVWEVDRFNWPNDIEQLFKAQTEYFDYAGKKLVAASREGLKILAVTSAQSGEGSTTLALCLARAAAGAGARAGLLDGNLVRSELGETLGVDFASGWQSAATFEQPLGEAAITGLEEGITLFPSSAGPTADLDSLADDRVGQVFRAAAASFDLLIIDAGTSDLGDNIETLDAAIVVRDVRRTSEEETLAVAAALRDFGVQAVGVAENFGSAKAKRAAA